MGARTCVCVCVSGGGGSEFPLSSPQPPSQPPAVIQFTSAPYSSGSGLALLPKATARSNRRQPKKVPWLHSAEVPLTNTRSELVGWEVLRFYRRGFSSGKLTRILLLLGQEMTILFGKVTRTCSLWKGDSNLFHLGK